MAGARPDTWMPIYWGDYLKHTGHLSTVEHGAYLLLIGHYWSSGAPLPDDDAKLRRIAKVETAAQWKKLRPTVAAFFTIGGGVWKHGRVDRELGAASKRSADAKAKAERAAKARWGGQHDDIPEAQLGAFDDDAPSNATSIGHTDPGTWNGDENLEAASPELSERVLGGREPQTIENAQNANATSMPGAMLEDCPSQSQSSSQSQSPVETTRHAADDSSSAAARAAAPPGPIDDDLAFPEHLRRSLQGSVDRSVFGEITHADTERAFAQWSAAAYDIGIPDAGFLNSDRRLALAKLLADCGMQRWGEAMARLRQADWLVENGRPKPWVNFKNIIKPETFMGLLEGRYVEHHDRQSQVPAERSPAHAGIAAARARRSVQPGS